MVRILPYCEMRNTYNHFNFSASVYAGANSTTRTTLVRSFICPSDNGIPRTPAGYVLTSYVACHNSTEAPIDATNDGVFILNRALRYEDIPDGSSNTVFVSEKRNDGTGEGWASGTRASLRNTGTMINASFPAGPAPAAAALGKPGEIAAPGTPAYVGGFSSRHPGIINAAFGDGSVRYLKSSIAPATLWMLGNRADGEILDSDKY
jgi:prepilin-type processing-associated H-X9-DG protein